MEHTLPELPYAHNALAPFISEETIEFHYGKHHNAYVTNLNKLIVGSPFEPLSLEEIITTTPEGPIFNNAAQVWNHTFYWLSLIPDGDKLYGPLHDEIIKKWGSVDLFKIDFTEAAMKHFGSGWVWLVLTKDNRLEIVTTRNAGNPLTTGAHPLLTCDVWEHAYYIDYRNARPKYVESFWKLASWEFAAKNYLSAVTELTKAA